MSGSGGGRRMIAGGMFLFATLGFIAVQIDRQRKQRQQQMTGSRTEYLRYLATIRDVARRAAAKQRAALNWFHPDPSALPSLAEDRPRLWERRSEERRVGQACVGPCRYGGEQYIYKNNNNNK